MSCILKRDGGDVHKLLYILIQDVNIRVDNNKVRVDKKGKGEGTNVHKLKI